jgi:hypothetical protein
LKWSVERELSDEIDGSEVGVAVLMMRLEALFPISLYLSCFNARLFFSMFRYMHYRIPITQDSGVPDCPSATAICKVPFWSLFLVETSAKCSICASMVLADLRTDGADDDEFAKQSNGA